MYYIIRTITGGLLVLSAQIVVLMRWGIDRIVAGPYSKRPSIDIVDSQKSRTER